MNDKTDFDLLYIGSNNSFNLIMDNNFMFVIYDIKNQSDLYLYNIKTKIFNKILDINKNSSYEEIEKTNKYNIVNLVIDITKSQEIFLKEYNENLNRIKTFYRQILRNDESFGLEQYKRFIFNILNKNFIYKINNLDISEITDTRLISVDDIRNLKISDIPNLKIDDNLSNDIIEALSNAQINALTETQIRSFNNRQLEAIRDINLIINELLPTQINKLSYDVIIKIDITDLKASQIGFLDPIQISYLTENQIYNLSPEQSQNITSQQSQNFTYLQKNYIKSDNNKIYNLFSAVNKQIIDNIKLPNNFDFTKISDLSSLNFSEIYSLTENQILLLSPSQIQTLKSDQVGSFKDKIRFFGENIKFFGKTQIEGLTITLYESFSGETTINQIQILSKIQIQSFTIEQLNNYLSIQQIRNLTDIQLYYFTNEQIRLFNEIISKFSLNQISKFTPYQIKSFDITKFSPEQISNLTIFQIRSLINNQINKLNQNQIKALSNEKIKELNISLLDKIQIPYIEIDKIKYLSIYQIGSLSEDQLKTLSKEQIQQITINQLKSLSDINLNSIRLNLTDDQKKGLITIEQKYDLLIKDLNIYDDTIKEEIIVCNDSYKPVYTPNLRESILKFTYILNKNKIIEEDKNNIYINYICEIENFDFNYKEKIIYYTDGYINIIRYYKYNELYPNITFNRYIDGDYVIFINNIDYNNQPDENKIPCNTIKQLKLFINIKLNIVGVRTINYNNVMKFKILPDNYDVIYKYYIFLLNDLINKFPKIQSDYYQYTMNLLLYNKDLNKQKLNIKSSIIDKDKDINLNYNAYLLKKHYNNTFLLLITIGCIVFILILLIIFIISSFFS